MIFFTHLTMLIAAFVGANLSVSELDLESQYRSQFKDPDIVVDYCWGHDDETDDYHNNYADSWYSWERCLLRDAQGAQIKYDNKHRLSKDEAQELVEEVWENYAPWMRAQFSQNLFFPWDDDDPDGDWYHVVLPEDWAPRLPLLNTGDKKVEEHCRDGAYGCARGPGLGFKTLKRVGETVSWLASDTYDRYPTYTAKLTYNSSGRIVTPKRNRFVILHELAHSINQWQYRWLDEGEEASDAEHGENERTEGHGYEFRCLALELYNDYGGNIAEIVPWWEESYAHLNRLCQIIAPGYAQPFADEYSAEDEES